MIKEIDYPETISHRLITSNIEQLKSTPLLRIILSLLFISERTRAKFFELLWLNKAVRILGIHKINLMSLRLFTSDGLLLIARGAQHEARPLQRWTC